MNTLQREIIIPLGNSSSSSNCTVSSLESAPEYSPNPKQSAFEMFKSKPPQDILEKNSSKVSQLPDYIRNVGAGAEAEADEGAAQFQIPITKPIFKISLNTTINKPTIPETPNVYLSTLKSLQHFDAPTWSEVRYADVQKTYVHSPGFVELTANDEVKEYENNSKQLQFTERSYAALSFALIKQNEVLESELQGLLQWAHSADKITYNDIKTKVDSIFLNGVYHQVSVDAVQLVCGHRANSIEKRRKQFLKYVKDPLIKTSLQKIPPSSNYLFEAEAFTTALEEAGGVRQMLWPVKRGPNAAAQKCLGHCKSSMPARSNYYNQRNRRSAQTYTHLRGNNYRWQNMRGRNNSGRQKRCTHSSDIPIQELPVLPDQAGAEKNTSNRARSQSY